MVFDELERQGLSQLYGLQHQLHSSITVAYEGSEFSDEVSKAWRAHDRAGRQLLPWYTWGPEKDLAEAYRDMQATGKDPVQRAAIDKLHDDLKARVDASRHEDKIIQLFQERAATHYQETREGMKARGTRRRHGHG